MPESLMGLAAVPVDDQVWILGGLSRDQGGREGGGTLTNSVYVFDPRSDTWEARPPMPQPRAFCATLSVERDIWIVGGVTQLTPPKCTSCIDFFRVSQGKWPPRELSSTTVEFQDDAPDAGKYVHHEPLPRNMDPNLGIVLHMDDSFLKTKSVLGLRATPDVLSAGLRSLQQSRQPCDPGCPVILTLGGLDPKNPLSSGSAVLRYHPFKDRWTLVNTMPEPRNYHAVAHLDRTLFVTGGYSTLIRKNGEMVATKTTFTMNVETGGWERLPDMLMHRACHASVATGGKVFVFGGRGRHGRLIATAEEYDISKNRWRPLTSMPEPRMGMAVVAKDGFVLLMGGMSEGENSVVSDVLRYSPQQNSWMAGDCLRHPRAYASAAVIDDCIWLCGGCVNADPKDGHPVSVNTVDVSRNGSGWRKACKLTVARHSAAAAAIGSCIYVLGGINSQEWGVLSRNVLIVTDRKAMLSPSSMPEPVAGHAAVTVSPPTSRYPSSSTKWSDAVFEKLA
ncbi:alpha-scruin-like [Haemaphysalis longicornis]